MTGKALGRGDRAEQIVTDLEQQFASAREANPQFAGKTAAIIYKLEKFGVYASEDPRSRLLTALGLKIPATIDKLAGDAFYAELSSERLRLVDQDVLVTYGPTPDKRKDVLEDPLYKRLDAVREGRDIYRRRGRADRRAVVLQPAEPPLRARAARPQAGVGGRRRPSDEGRRGP